MVELEIKPTKNSGLFAEVIVNIQFSISKKTFVVPEPAVFVLTKYG